ncbi:MAG: class SAM-dependent methyltransferase [Daejeonella sp.]|nr:class SAM-dependent methyltransferase [Daejeonella sp.]
MDISQLAKQLRKPEGDAGVSVGKIMNEGNAGMYQLTFEMLGLEAKYRVLEIGFGNGKFIPELLSLADNVYYVGIDYSDVMVESASKLIEETHISNAEVIQASVSEMPFPDGSFNRAFTINTLYFWPDPEKDIMEIKRVLAESGCFCMAFRPPEVLEKTGLINHGFKSYSLAQVIDLFTVAGFKNISHEFQEGQVHNNIAFSSYCIKGFK